MHSPYYDIHRVLHPNRLGLPPPGSRVEKVPILRQLVTRPETPVETDRSVSPRCLRKLIPADTLRQLMPIVTRTSVYRPPWTRCSRSSMCASAPPATSVFKPRETASPRDTKTICPPKPNKLLPSPGPQIPQDPYRAGPRPGFSEFRRSVPHRYDRQFSRALSRLLFLQKRAWEVEEKK